MYKIFSIINLGCPKNLVDSEAIMGIFVESGFHYTDELGIAEVIIVNTCSFIKPARKESLDIIKEVVRLKKKGVCKKIIVVGCLVQTEGMELKKRISGIDVLIGVNDIPKIMEIAGLKSVEEKALESNSIVSEPVWIYDGYPPRVLTGKPHYAYLKIADGCNHLCSFCTIPKIKGGYRSRKIESVVGEAKGLAMAGIKEMILVSQDCTYYGFESGRKNAVVKLLNKLVQISEFRWIRLLYLYPDYISDELIKIMSEKENICKYFDIPFQHCSERILKLMRRGGDKMKYFNLIDRIREKIPEASLRTTMIVGFPGETEEDFNELVDFCEKVQFDNLGVFIYYDERDADSNKLDDKIPYKEKIRRRRMLLNKQKEILSKKNEKMRGKIVNAVIDDINDEYIQLRHEGMAPEVDGMIYIRRGQRSFTLRKDIRVGEFVKVRLLTIEGYDYVGELI